MSAPAEVISAFDAAIPGHSGVEDWAWISTTGLEWRALWRELDVYARPQPDGWDVTARLPAVIGGQGTGTDADLATSIRAAVKAAAKVLTRYADKQARAAARRMARAAEAQAMAATWSAHE